LTEVKGAGTNFKQQRRHEQEIVATDEDDFDIRPPPAQSLQIASRIDSTEAAAEDHDPGSRWVGIGIFMHWRHVLLLPSVFSLLQECDNTLLSVLLNGIFGHHGHRALIGACELSGARSGQSMVRTMRKRALPAIIFA
jgi:hypothetical protein